MKKDNPKKDNPKNWICKKCGLNLNWEDKNGKVISPNYCSYCRSPSSKTHYYKSVDNLNKYKIKLFTGSE